MKKILSFSLILLSIYAHAQSLKVGVGECISGTCFNGQGTYVYDHGRYIGEWKNGARHGNGTFTFLSGRKYEGEWQYDKEHGKGVLTFAKREGYVIASKFDGYFKELNWYGSGTLTTFLGVKYYSDNWDHHNTIKKVTWPNGTKYELIVNSDKSEIDYNSVIYDYVTFKVNEWQKKGEFEKIVDYNIRVNEYTRNQEIEKHQKNAINYIEEEWSQTVNSKNIELKEYDAENETFLLSSDYIGEFILSVPIEEAPSFKEYYNSAMFYLTGFRFSNNTFTLLNCTIDIWAQEYKFNRRYEYSNENQSSYAKTKIHYNFPEISINISQNVQHNRVIEQINSITVGKSAVDLNIPSNPKVENRYALIIGNEDYTSYQSGLSTEQNVDFAENDAKIFKEYALNTLGVKEDNLYFLANATAGQMKQKITLVTEIIKQVGYDAELIFYYAGHGYPDELTKVPYLIPVDISANDLSSAINLSDLYKTLSESNAKRITVFLDACFTGGARAQGLVASRGIKISPKQDELNGNLVLFSASSDTQSSLPYKEQGHGMFTYFLLEKLQSSKGKCTYLELFDYLEEKVSLNSLKVNEKKQNPKVSSSPSVNDKWGSWNF